MKETTEINLIPDPANPNRMDADTKAMMAKSLAEFGDLGGIVLNRRTGMLVGGHQRADVLRDGKLAVTDLQDPEPDGTVARGHLVCNGRRYAVRVVDWAEDKAHAALLAANRFGRLGQDDAALLKDLLEELDCGQKTDAGELLADLTGFDAEARSMLTDRDTPMKPVAIQEPPRMAWVLVGVPIGEWGKVSGLAEAAALIEGSIVETTANDGIKED